MVKMVKAGNTPWVEWFYNIVSDSVTWYNFLNQFGNLFLSRTFDLFNSTFKLPPKETMQPFEKKNFVFNDYCVDY